MTNLLRKANEKSRTGRLPTVTTAIAAAADFVKWYRAMEPGKKDLFVKWCAEWENPENLLIMDIPLTIPENLSSSVTKKYCEKYCDLLKESFDEHFEKAYSDLLAKYLLTKSQLTKSQVRISKVQEEDVLITPTPGGHFDFCIKKVLPSDEWQKFKRRYHPGFLEKYFGRITKWWSRVFQI